MNNIEFQLIREDLHLSRHDLAEIWEVNPARFKGGDRGDVPIPQNRKEQMQNYYLSVLQAVENFKTVLNERIKENGEPDSVLLLAYDAWSYDGDFPHYKIHNACLIKCKQEAINRGFECSIVPFKPQEYEEWLGAEEDTQAMRSAWAAEYYAIHREVADIDEITED